MGCSEFREEHDLEVEAAVVQLLQACFAEMTRITEGIHDRGVIDTKRRMGRLKGSFDGALNVVEE